MDIGLLEKSEHMKPLLVKLYDTHHMYSLAGTAEPQARSELGDIVSELLDVSVSDREKDLVADILLALIQQAEGHLKKVLADKLATSPDAPSRLVLNLAYDDIDVAANILRHSPVLEALDLMYILQSKPIEYARVIAEREALPEQIVDDLSALDDEKVHEVLAANDAIILSEAALEKIYETAKVSDAVAEPLLARSDIPGAMAKKLYEFVGSYLKDFIQEKYGFAGAIVDETIQEVVKEVQDDGLYLFLPSHAMVASEQVKSQMRTERESQIRNIMLREMISTLQLKKFKHFVAKFSVFMGISAEDSIEILSQQYGHGLAILCRAHNVERPEFTKMFLLSDKIRSSTHVMQGITLTRALAYYDRMDVDLARDLYQKNFTVV